jgi:hypothetical protein
MPNSGMLGDGAMGKGVLVVFMRSGDMGCSGPGEARIVDLGASMFGSCFDRLESLCNGWSACNSRPGYKQARKSDFGLVYGVSRQTKHQFHGKAPVESCHCRR